MAYATIRLELYPSGMRFICEDCEMEDVIAKGDAGRLVELINEVDEVCDPDTVFTLSDGKSDDDK